MQAEIDHDRKGLWWC